MLAKSVCRDIFLVGKPWPRTPLFLNSHARGIPTIMVGMFIVLENPSSVIGVMTRTFISLGGPPKASEGIIVIIKGFTPAKTVSGISYLMGVPPNSPDKVVVSTIAACVDHC